MKSETAIKKILEKLHAGFGESSAVMLGGGTSRSEVTEVIPTGIEVFDKHVLGCGGLAVGKLHELAGDEGAGKSALTYQCLAATQRMGGIALLVETEEALSTERAQTFGVDLDQLVVIQPDYMEMGLSQMEASLQAIQAGTGPVLLAWDSIAATPTKKEFEEGMDVGAEMGERARILSRACRILLPLAQRKRTALLFVNQIRQKIGVMYGDPTTTPGGNAVKFHASFRAHVSSGKAIKDSEEHTGKYVNLRAKKNRFAEPHRGAALRLDFKTGWNDAWSTLDFAKERGVVKDNARGDKALAEARSALGWAAPPTA